MSGVELSHSQEDYGAPPLQPVAAIAAASDGVASGSAASGTAAPQELFPLPLAPLETLVVSDDRDAYPMTFFGELRFSGVIIRHALERALEVAAARHPLLMARLEGPARARYWTAGQRPSPPVIFESDYDFSSAQDESFPRHPQPLDLHAGIGLRLWVRTGADSSRMLLEFHHACCDGKGAVRFIRDMLGAYVDQVAPRSATSLDQLDPMLLRQRGVFQPRPPAAGSRAAHWLKRLRETAGFHFCNPRPLATDRQPEASPINRDYPGIQTHYVDREETLAIHAAAARAGANLNDIGLALLFRVVGDWQAERSSDGRAGNMRILMPADLRERRDARLPAANRVSLCFIFRRPEQCQSWPKLLEGIQQETRYIKQTRLGVDLLDGIGLLCGMPAALKLAMKFPRCQATAILTNLSDPTRAFRNLFPRDDGRLVIGNLTIDQMTGSPPLRPGTRAAFGIGMYAGRIVLTLRLDPWLFTADDTRTLLGNYRAAWREFAQMA